MSSEISSVTDTVSASLSCSGNLKIKDMVISLMQGIFYHLLLWLRSLYLFICIIKIYQSIVNFMPLNEKLCYAGYWSLYFINPVAEDSVIDDPMATTPS